MKVYMFDPNSGLYEGEDYWQSGEVSEEAGVTSLAPPEAQPGQVPVYDRTVSNWKSVPIDCMKKAEKRND